MSEKKEKKKAIITLEIQELILPLMEHNLEEQV